MGTLRLFHLILNFLPHSVASDLGLHCLQMSQSRFYTQHSDKNTAAINNCFLDFVQTRDLILLLNDIHVDNNLTEILVYVHVHVY